jgi:prevent-host-death family protein
MAPVYRAGAIMKTKFSEDVIPLSDLKINPGKVINQTKETHRPILLTSHGRGVAVVQDLEEYEKDQEELALDPTLLKILFNKFNC